MYTRLTTFQADSSKLDTFEQTMGPVREQLAQISGMVSCHSSWTSTGSGAVFAVYESKELAEAAAEKIGAVWGSLASMLTAPPATTVYDHVAVLKG